MRGSAYLGWSVCWSRKGKPSKTAVKTMILGATWGNEAANEHYSNEPIATFVTLASIARQKLPKRPKTIPPKPTASPMVQGTGQVKKVPGRRMLPGPVQQRSLSASLELFPPQRFLGCVHLWQRGAVGSLEFLVFYSVLDNSYYRLGGILKCSGCFSWGIKSPTQAS